MGDLKETAAQVAALIPRYSWELLDEEQKDTLLEKVILPRYMQRTHDGVTLNSGWWSEQVGASPAAIKSRVQRLQNKAKAANGKGSSTPWKQDVGRRVTRQALREEPKVYAPQIAAALGDPEVLAAVIDAHPNIDFELITAAHQTRTERIRQTPRVERTEFEPGTREAVKPDPWEHWYKAHKLLNEGCDLLDRVHENFSASAWNRPWNLIDGYVRFAEDTGERLRSATDFLDGIAEAGRDHVAS